MMTEDEVHEKTHEMLGCALAASLTNIAADTHAEITGVDDMTRWPDMNDHDMLVWNAVAEFVYRYFGEEPQP